MKHWEYRIIRKLDKRPNWTWWLNQAGQDGWELLTVRNDSWIFKREITFKIQAIRNLLAAWANRLRSEEKEFPPKFVNLACRFGQRT